MLFYFLVDVSGNKHVINAGNIQKSRPKMSLIRFLVDLARVLPEKYTWILKFNISRWVFTSTF